MNLISLAITSINAEKTFESPKRLTTWLAPQHLAASAPIDTPKCLVSSWRKQIYSHFSANDFSKDRRPD